MRTLSGKYNSANIMIDSIDDATREQIQTFLDHPAFAKTYIAVMPDCHAGVGAVVGFTAKMNDYIIPNIVGVDINCGVNAYNLGHVQIDFAALDTFIRHNIPSGFTIRGDRQTGIFKLQDILDAYINPLFHVSLNETAFHTGQKLDRILQSLGTLGGGNHFLEIDVAENGEYWLLIHSGSRNFGLQVAKHYQEKARVLAEKMLVSVPKGLEYLPLDLGGEEYLDDMAVAQHYAHLNRQTMANVIALGFLGYGVPPIATIESVHNYIDFSDRIIRKGAVSAKDREKLVIPFNMRDGVALCTGKGSKKWNFSAPHGAGRIMSRTAARKTLTLADFQNAMTGIFTTTATQDTLDEAPGAYKNKDDILAAIQETVSVDQFLRPVYNYKAAEKR